MFRQGKKKRFSIGEKIRYFDSISRNPLSSKKKKLWAQQRKNTLLNEKREMNLGDIYVVDDKFMGNPQKKPRLVVIAKANGNRVDVIPVKKDNKIMSLSNFDGERALNMNAAKSISKDYLYEKRGFKFVKNAYLTPREKTRLHKKVQKYL